MRVGVFGPGGMLGQYVVRELGADAVPIHRKMYQLLDVNSIRHTLDDLGVEKVINCAGVIPVKSLDPIEMIQVNAMFPHLLVRAAGERQVLLVSTDCVFSGRNRFRYTTSDVQDPRDFYGKSKSMGEVPAPNSSIIRTSFIGCAHGLMRTVLAAGQTASKLEQPVEVSGWKCALWNGSTVQAVAHALVTEDFPIGLVHLSAKNTTTKFDVVSKLVEMNNFNVTVRPDYYPTYNRALSPTVILQDVFEALDEYKCIGSRAA